jgi:hypothetical protein
MRMHGHSATVLHIGSALTLTLGMLGRPRLLVQVALQLGELAPGGAGLGRPLQKLLVKLAHALDRAQLQLQLNVRLEQLGLDIIGVD